MPDAKEKFFISTYRYTIGSFYPTELDDDRIIYPLTEKTMQQLPPYKTFYYQVKHCPYEITISAKVYLSRYLTLNWIREIGAHYSEFYSEEEIEKDYWMDIFWERILDTPRYADTPIEIRDKIAPVDYPIRNWDLDWTKRRPLFEHYIKEKKALIGR